MSVPGTQYRNLSTTVTGTQSTVINAGVASGQNSQHNGKILFQNPNSSGDIFLGLSGETLVVASRLGFWLAPGAFLVFDLRDAPINAVTAIASTTLPLTIYAMGA